MKKEPVTPLKEKLISFETAMLAKEKGFDLPVTNFYTSKGTLGLCTIGSEFFDTEYRTPTLSFLQMWLREIHELDVYVISEDNSTYWYNLHGENINPKDYRLEFGEDDLYNSTYEEALEIGLLAALKLIHL